MQIIWSREAVRDLRRLQIFIEDQNPRAASNARKSLVAASEGLSAMPLMGRLRQDMKEHAVHSLVVGAYEVRYQAALGHIRILRIWHTREQRS